MRMVGACELGPITRGVWTKAWMGVVNSIVMRVDATTMFVRPAAGWGQAFDVGHVAHAYDVRLRLSVGMTVGGGSMQHAFSKGQQ